MFIMNESIIFTIDVVEFEGTCSIFIRSSSSQPRGADAKGPSEHHAIGSFAPLAFPVCNGHPTSETALGLHLYSNLLPLKEIGPQEVPGDESYLVDMVVHVT